MDKGLCNLLFDDHVVYGLWVVVFTHSWVIGMLSAVAIRLLGKVVLMSRIPVCFWRRAKLILKIEIN
jgi:hypothetical protein